MSLALLSFLRSFGGVPPLCIHKHVHLNTVTTCCTKQAIWSYFVGHRTDVLNCTSSKRLKFGVPHTAYKRRGTMVLSAMRNALARTVAPAQRATLASTSTVTQRYYHENVSNCSLRAASSAFSMF